MTLDREVTIENKKVDLRSLNTTYLKLANSRYTRSASRFRYCNVQCARDLNFFTSKKVQE
jgi:hypothetical protein